MVVVDKVHLELDGRRFRKFQVQRKKDRSRWRVVGKKVLGAFQDIFSSGSSSREFSQVATSQMCNFPSGNFPKVRLGPLRRRRLQWGPSVAACMGQGAERRGQNRVEADCCCAARTDLGSCRLGNCRFGKLPLGKNPLGKYLTLEKRELEGEGSEGEGLKEEG